MRPARTARTARTAALVLLLCCPPAFAQARDDVRDAHDFLQYTFDTQTIEYIAWYGRGYADHHRGQVAFFGGGGCISELRAGAGAGGGYAIDWTRVPKVQPTAAELVYVVGQMDRLPAQEGRRQFADLHLVFPDSKVAKRAYNALQVLRSACDRRSRFD